jgi:hypothetical protein
MAISLFEQQRRQERHQYVCSHAPQIMAALITGRPETRWWQIGQEGTERLVEVACELTDALYTAIKKRAPRFDD